MSNLQTYYHFKLDFQKVDQHTGGKWLIHGAKHRKDNQLQSLELPCRIYMAWIYHRNSKGIILNNRNSWLIMHTSGTGIRCDIVYAIEPY